MLFRSLAARRGSTVTDAVRQALTAELARSAEASSENQKAAKRERLLTLLARYRQLAWPDQRSSQELQNDLYDANGLPV